MANYEFLLLSEEAQVISIEADSEEEAKKKFDEIRSNSLTTKTVVAT